MERRRRVKTTQRFKIGDVVERINKDHFACKVGEFYRIVSISETSNGIQLLDIKTGLEIRSFLNDELITFKRQNFRSANLQQMIKKELGL